MEFNEDFIKEHNLAEEQVSAVKSYINKEIVPNLKKTYEEEYKGEANKNAEGILDGASRFAQEKLGISVEREKGEKWGDYLSRVTETHFESKQKDLENKEKEYQEKIKNFKGSEAYQEELQKLKEEKDSLLKQVAELEPLKGIDEKYKDTVSKLTNMQKEVAYNSVKPNFPETVNKYEADAKWNEFKRAVEDKYTIELKDGKPIAVDKDNHHKVVELSELVSNDNNISDLLKGRQQRGLNAKPSDLVSVEGLPFKVPKGASSTELTKIVREHVVKEVGDISSPKYAQRFSELYSKAKQNA